MRSLAEVEEFEKARLTSFSQFSFSEQVFIFIVDLLFAHQFFEFSYH